VGVGGVGVGGSGFKTITIQLQQYNTFIYFYCNDIKI